MLDASVAARDQPLALERPQHDRDSRAMHAKHHRKKFLFEREGVVVNAIARLQQPSAAPLGHVVQRVAGGALHDLQQIRLSIDADDIAKRPGARGLLGESRGGHRRQRAIGHLLECATNSGAITEEDADPQHAFAPHGCHFHEPAIPHFVGDGVDTTVREVDVLDPHTVRLQGIAGGHGAHSDVGQDSVVFGTWQSREEPIVQPGPVGQEPDRIDRAADMASPLSNPEQFRCFDEAGGAQRRTASAAQESRNGERIT